MPPVDVEKPWLLTDIQQECIRVNKETPYRVMALKKACTSVDGGRRSTHSSICKCRIVTFPSHHYAYIRAYGTVAVFADAVPVGDINSN
jgi:hypothetical protein